MHNIICKNMTPRAILPDPTLEIVISAFDKRSQNKQEITSYDMVQGNQNGGKRRSWFRRSTGMLRLNNK